MARHGHATVSGQLESRLEALLAGSDPAVPAHDVLVVVAHPDDEAIGCGGQLIRWRDVTVAVVTDGAPRNARDAQERGFADAAAYARARREELLAALALADIPAHRTFGFGIPDQEAAFCLPRLARDLAAEIAGRRTGVVVTHAYEGGHPDHDAVAFAAHTAAAIVGAKAPRPLLVEMPLYRADGDGMAVQSFLPGPAEPSVVRWLSDAERQIKRRMVAAHRTQQAVLASFALDPERFRLAPRYDFGEPPNGGALLYARYDWGLDGARWLALARGALADLEGHGDLC